MEEQEQKLSERLTLKLLSRSFVFRILIIDMLALSLSVCIHTHARAHTHTYIYIYNRNHKLSFEENLTNSCCHRCSRVCWGFFKSEDCCSGAYSTCLLLVLKCACSPTCCFWRWYILELLDFWPSQSSAQYQFSAVLRGWQFVTSAWNQIQLTPYPDVLLDLDDPKSWRMLLWSWKRHICLFWMRSVLKVSLYFQLLAILLAECGF